MNSQGTSPFAPWVCEKDGTREVEIKDNDHHRRDETEREGAQDYLPRNEEDRDTIESECEEMSLDQTSDSESESENENENETGSENDFDYCPLEEEGCDVTNMTFEGTSSSMPSNPAQGQEREEETEKEREKNEKKREKETLSFAERETLQDNFNEAVQAERQNFIPPSWVPIVVENEGEDSAAAHREKIVAWEIELCESLLILSRATLHLAIDLLDGVNGLFIDRGKIPLAAIACISIAAKQEEQERDVPSLKRLDYAIGAIYSPQLIAKMELFVLNKLGWRVLRWTSITFLENLIARGATNFNPAIDRYGNNDTDIDIEESLAEYSRHFCDIALKDMRLSQEMYSVRAVAAIVCSRAALGVEPQWPTQLTELSGYSFPQVQQCAQRMWQIYHS